MINLKDLIPKVLAEMEARKSAMNISNRDTEQLALFGRIYELYVQEKAELNRMFYDFERSFEQRRRA
jgi:hypothetical protein